MGAVLGTLHSPWWVSGYADGEALDDVRSPLWWAAFLMTLFLIGAVSWTWAGEVESWT